MTISLERAAAELGLDVTLARRIEVDQTNQSWIVETARKEQIVVKLLNEPSAESPAADRLRRLDAAGFTGTPKLIGITDHAIATAYVPGTDDGWTWCVDEARLALGVKHGSAQPFATELGELTAQMHLALRTDEDAQDGDLVLGHGDFHVGQILRAPGGPLYVIDFDGNPTLPPDERRSARPAAYDVAGMLLSLENVGYVVQKYNAEVTDEAAAAWSDGVQREFLDAYRTKAADLLDESLLEPMMLAQIQREFEYADQHLPRWRYVPEAAMRRRGLW